MAIIETRLLAAGVSLPQPPALKFDYEPVRTDRGVAYLAGQIPKTGQDKVLYTAPIGSGISESMGQEAAGLCVLNGLSWLKHALGDLDSIAMPLSLRGYVVADDRAINPSRVIDGATQMLVNAFGALGRCPRTVIGVTQLPFDSPVLIEMTFSLR